GLLRQRIEAADRLDRLAEEIEPDWLGGARRVEIDEAAADRELARLAHRAGAVEAMRGQKGGELFELERAAALERQRRPGEDRARRDALQDRAHGRDDDGPRPLPRLRAG